jgi:ATP-dependent DNA helicase RecG
MIIMIIKVSDTMKLLESTTIEFKREYTPEINKTVVAFANTNGGRIYIGIDDDGTPKGVDNVDETLLKTTNNIRDSIKPDVTLFINHEMEIMSGKHIIILIVQKGTDCPYYIAKKGLRPEGVYVRHAASTVPASETAILKMIKETDGEEYEDVRSLNQELTFSYAKKEFEKAKVDFGKAQMKTLQLISPDGLYSNLALLLSDQCVHTIKLAVFEGTTKTIFKDRFECSGSLLYQLNEAFEYIDRFNRTRAEFEGIHRIDKRDYPMEAVREALLNSIVHREYAFSGSILISIFDDRIELISLGGLVKGISYDDIMLGASILRNRNLANVFYRLKLIEAYGIGMPKIIESYREYSVKPQIEVSDNAFKITLPNLNESHISAATLTVNEQTVLSLLEKSYTIIREDAQKELQLSQPMAVKILRQMLDKKLIKKIGSGKNTRYEKYRLL